MSNTQVGNVYQQIIADVVESSRVDFEEGGVDEQVLEELRSGWQKKLSGLNVATFPWDPKPEPLTPLSNPPTVPSNVGNYHSMNTPPQNLQPQQPGMQQQMPQMPRMPQIPGNGAGPHIKAEPGMDSPPMAQQPYQNSILTLPAGSTAQERAAQHLQNNYGPRAAASINAIQSSRQAPPNLQQQQQQQQQPTPQQQMQMHHMHQQQIQNRTQGHPGQQPHPTMTPEQYNQAMAQRQAAQIAGRQNPQNPQNGFKNPPQTDGADDTEAVIKQVDGNGEEVTMGRVEIDGLIRKKIEAMGQSMEGGGLMLPLQELKKASKSKAKSKSSKRERKVGAGQTDGGDSDEDVKTEEVDEDAINSDLDDPDDGLNDEEDEDEGMGHIMLCMYDKVQRVKNKWKCVMKDGVLTVNGKEYVFHKASGEYEW